MSTFKKTKLFFSLTGLLFSFSYFSHAFADWTDITCSCPLDPTSPTSSCTCPEQDREIGGWGDDTMSAICTDQGTNTVSLKFINDNGCSSNGIWINNIDNVEPYKTNFDLHNCAASSGGLGVVITCSKISQ